MESVWQRLQKYPDAKLLETFLRHGEGDSSTAFVLEDPRRCALALDWLVQQGQLEAFQRVAKALRECFPKYEFFETMEMHAAHLPEPPLGGWTDFIDDRKADFQCVERLGARATLVAFCGMAHMLGMPLNLAQAWFSQWPVNVVYLRNFSHRFYLDGLRSIPGGYDGMVEALRQRLDLLGNLPLICYGTSRGGFGALKLAIELGADIVQCMMSPSNIEPAFVRDNNIKSDYSDFYQWNIGLAQDLRTPLLNMTFCKKPMRVRMYYGDRVFDDRCQAQNLAGIPGVELCEVVDCDQHNIVTWLIREKQFARNLSLLFDGL